MVDEAVAGDLGLGFQVLPGLLWPVTSKEEGPSNGSRSSGGGRFRAGE